MLLGMDIIALELIILDFLKKQVIVGSYRNLSVLINIASRQESTIRRSVKAKAEV